MLSDTASLQVALILHLDENTPRDGAILVFLPGWDDIAKVHDALESQPQSASWRLFPLHGSIPTAQQRAIFARPPPNVRKIVVSTNIAESSITIDDVRSVLPVLS